jgi:hypothetical protein
MRNKRIKPVLFGSKRISNKYSLHIRLHSLRTEYHGAPYLQPLDGTPKQAKQISHEAEFTTDIRHIAEAANAVADTLSRPPGHMAAKDPP